MKTFSASLADWADRTAAAMREVMRDSTQDVLEAAQTAQVSMARGATSVEQGKVPVDIGDLRNSLASGLNGSFGPPSKDSYGLVIEGMEIGDVAQFEWTSDHALPIELGHGTYPGAHFVGANAARWEEFVNANAARLKP